MEDYIHILLIIGFILIGIFRQISKNKSKENAETDIPVPIPPTPFEAFQQRKASKKAKLAKQKQLIPRSEEGVRSTHVPILESPPQQTNETEAAGDSEYAIDSPDAARQAIVWSEILQRKY